MPWWERPLDRLKGRFAPDAAHTPDPQPGPPVAVSPNPTGAWGDVPPLQRTLAAPIRPVALNDQFRNSLASFSDPSFLAPLSHQVDPSVGGLVAGLVSQGEPQTHGGPELTVLQRPPAPVQRTVQRLATWSAPPEHLPTVPPDDLQTVPLEYSDPVADVPPPALAQGAEPWSTGTEPATDVRLLAPAPATPQVQLQRTPATPEEASSTIEPTLPVPLPDVQEPLAAAPPDMPTLGARPAPAPLFAFTEPPASALAAREPAVQRLRYEQPPIQRQSRAAPSTAPADRPDRSVVAANKPEAPPHQVTVQTSRERAVEMSRERQTPQGPPPTTIHGGDPTVATEPRWVQPSPDADDSTPPQPAEFDSAPWPDIVVSRLAESAPSAAVPEEPGFVEEPLVVAWQQSAPTLPATASSLGGHVDVEPLAGGPSASRTPDVQRVSPLTRIAAPIVAVQRRTPEAGSPAVRPELSVPSGNGAGAAPSGSTRQPPLVVARVAATAPPRGAFRPNSGSEVSFAHMFSGASRAPAPSEPSDDHVVVQRDVATAPTPTEATLQAEGGDAGVILQASAGGAPGAPGLGSAGGNLDEIARRLYEPLAARLREELWLDRERAGLMSDG